MVDGVLEAARWILEDAIDHSDETSRQASLAWLKTAPLKALHPSRCKETHSKCCPVQYLAL